MPTGLKINKLSFAKMGNINIQAIKSQSENNNNGNLNIQGAAVVGANKIVGKFGGNISQNANMNVSPFVNQFQKLQISIPNLKIPANISLFDSNSLVISPIVAQYFVPAKLKGISEQRPEIISLADYSSIYGRGYAFSDVGEFINTSIAARKLRHNQIETLIESIQEVEDANSLLQEIVDKYADEVNDAKDIVKLMYNISSIIENIKKSLNVRKSESFTDKTISKNIVSSKSYKDFLVDLYGFSESGVNNFSNTKLIGQFLLDARNTLKQYSPSLFGSSNAQSPDSINVDLKFQANQPALNVNFYNANFGLSKAANQIKNRSADKEFGSYNASELNISDGEFDFKIRSFRNIAFSMIGTAYNQLLDSLPGNPADRSALLLMTISKEMSISSGLGNENIKSTLIDKMGGSDIGDPFETIVGSPGDSITDIPNGKNSLCSLLRYKNKSNDVVLPFESLYVKGENEVLYIPGTKEFGDSILQSKDPYDTTKIKGYQEKVSDISSDSIYLIKKLSGEEKQRLGPVSLFTDIGTSYIEAIDLLISNIPSANVSNIAIPGSWGEAGLIKLAFSDREIRHLLFQYVLALGLVGKPGMGEFGNNSVEPFFRDMALNELRNWGDLPVINQDQDLNDNATEKLNYVLTNTLGLEQVNDPNIDTGDISSKLTTSSTTGYTVLAFITQILISKAKLKGDKNGGPGMAIFIDHLIIHLISTKSLVFMNRIADFISTIANRSGNFTDLGRSRFNRLNYTTIAAFAFEAYLSYLEPLFNGITDPNTNDETMNISFDVDALKESQYIVGIVSKSFNLKSIATNNKQYSDFSSLQAIALNSPIGGLKSKLEKEEEIVRQIISRITRTFTLVESATSDAIDFFRKDGLNASKLMELIESQGGKERVALINEAQFILSRKAIYDFSNGGGQSILTGNANLFSGGANRSPVKRVSLQDVKKLKRARAKKNQIVPFFADGSMITTNEKRLMQTILRRPKFLGSRSENLKILTVGIPAGFSDYLSREISITEDNSQEILNKERDVISINVYKRSIEFEDIVFKPKPYIFELSRFITRDKVNKKEIKYSDFLEFTNDKSIEFTSDFAYNSISINQDKESFLENEEYSFLSKEQKEKIAINHMENFILGLYLKLLIGVSTDENDYLVNTSLLEGYIDSESKDKFNDLVLTYVRGITKQPLTLDQLKNSSPQIKKLLEKIDTFALDTNFTEQITPPVLPGVGIDQRIELTEDLINFIKLFTPKSLLTGGKIQSLRITSPKLFERIFNLAVDPDDFEIDFEKTIETTSGKKMYSILQEKKLLKTLPNGSITIKERSKNNTISLDQFFVNISTVQDDKGGQ